MIKVFLTETKGLKEIPFEEAKKGCWFDLIAPNDKELETLSALINVPLDMLKVSLDEEERAHIERDDGCTLIVVDTPQMEESDSEGMQIKYSTIPLGMIYNEDYFVTVSLRECAVVSDFLEGRVKDVYSYKRTRNVLMLLLRNSTKFLQHLKLIDRVSNRVQSELRRSMKNKELIQLMELEKSLVYFATGINANEYVLERFRTFEEIKKYEEDVELMDDVIRENKQAQEMCSIYSDILSGTMDAFASIVSNNLNIVMKVFTMISIILAIPTLITSIWGMNVNLPFMNHPLGFIIVIIIAFILSALGIIAIVKINNSLRLETHKKRKKKHLK
ncbi:MAG: magnesium transporter CorA family protein [Clostridia bacterium]